MVSHLVLAEDSPQLFQDTDFNVRCVVDQYVYPPVYLQRFFDYLIKLCLWCSNVQIESRCPDFLESLKALNTHPRCCNDVARSLGSQRRGLYVFSLLPRHCGTRFRGMEGWLFSIYGILLCRSKLCRIIGYAYCGFPAISWQGGGLQPKFV